MLGTQAKSLGQHPLSLLHRPTFWKVSITGFFFFFLVCLSFEFALISHHACVWRYLVLRNFGYCALVAFGIDKERKNWNIDSLNWLVGIIWWELWVIVQLIWISVLIYHLIMAFLNGFLYSIMWRNLKLVELENPMKVWWFLVSKMKVKSLK